MSKQTRDPLLLHIIETAAWEAAQTQGSYVAASLETEGFIHLSQPQQVVWVANQFYKGQSGLLLLCIDPTLLVAELRYDDVPGHGTFPHLYGPLNLSAIAQAVPFPPETDGTFTLPAAVRALDG